MPKQERLVFITLSVAALATALLSFGNIYAANTEVVPTQGGEYREGIIGQPKFLNPVLASAPVDKAINRLVYSGLYTYDESGNIIPDLAEAMPEIDETRKIYTIKLRPNAQWHNNVFVTAEDVVYTIQSIQNEEYSSPRRSEWLSTTVEKVDNQTVKFILQDASAPFIHNLTVPIISKTAWSKISPSDFPMSDANIEAIGSGPYTIKEVRKNADGTIQSISLRAFENYHHGRAFIETIKLSFYENTEEVTKAIHGKQIDGFGYSPFEQDIALDKSAKSFKFSQIPLPQYQAVFFNLNRKLFQDNTLRKALQIGTDYQAIIDQAYKGQGKRIYGPILPEQVESINTIGENFNASLDSAISQLEQAGWVFAEGASVRSRNGANLEFNLSTNDLPLNVEVAGLLANQWQQLGAKVNVTIQTTKELTEKTIFPREFDALLFAQKLGADPDPFIFWHSSQVKNPGLNLTGYANSTADTLVNEARAANDPALREAKYTEFQRIILRDVPAIFLAQNVYAYAQSEDIKGQNYQSLHDETLRFVHAAKWYIETKRDWK